MYLFIAIIIGFILSTVFPNQDIRNFPSYELILYTLLALGLYGSVHGIDIDEFRSHRNLIIRAITFGVVLKSIITGSVLWFIFHTPYAFLFGIIVAQIDPLSVAHLIKEKSRKFSTAGRTILRAWSSFDDPMTVLLALYIFLPIVVKESGSFSPESYIFQLGTNLAFALLVWLVNRSVAVGNKMSFILLVASFLIAIPFKLMLGIALVGLFLRPNLKHLPLFVHIAFIVSALILGSLLEINTQSILYGIVLGIIAFTAQAVVTFLVAPRLNQADKTFLSFAQYNGITSIILALIIGQWIAQTVSVVAFAIITINILYYSSNHFLEKNF